MDPEEPYELTFTYGSVGRIGGNPGLYPELNEGHRAPRKES